MNKIQKINGLYGSLGSLEHMKKVASIAAASQGVNSINNTKRRVPRPVKRGESIEIADIDVPLPRSMHGYTE